jgi:putative nucleotidyltransferase with HDIG domain
MAELAQENDEMPGEHDAVVPPPAGRVLIVDDESSILSALRRLLRPQGLAIFTAESGKAALELLEKEPMDLVVSDMRMPEMDGAQLLEQVFTRWPETKRILLTGHSDTGATIAAINRGKIWRYIAKPWNDDEIILTIQQALAHRQLLQDNARLTKLTRQQNKELKELNAGLEQKVAERTAELRHGFLATVHVFSDLIEMREARLAGHSRRVANLARRLAERLGFADAEQQDVLLAGLLHDIGKVGLADALLEKPFNSLPPSVKAEVMEHPAKGQQLLKGVAQLANAAKIIRHHHEANDGSGYPDGLAGQAIPYGARILALANDYDALQMGTLLLHSHTPREAQEYLVKQRGKRYDPVVVDAFTALLTESQAKSEPEFSVTVPELRLGMLLTRDLMHPDGHVLLARGRIVDNAVMAKLRRIEEMAAPGLTLYIRRSTGPAVLRDRNEALLPKRLWKERVLTTTQLKEGMILSRHIHHHDGYLLLASGYHLDEMVIKQLRDIEATDGHPITIHIQVEDR